MESVGVRILIGMGRNPVLGDLYPAADPYLGMLLNVIEKTLQRIDTRRPSDDAAMQAHREHLRRIQPRWIAFAVERIEGRLQIVEKLGAGVEPLHRRKAHIVGIQGVGHHEMRYDTRLFGITYCDRG